MNKEQAYDELVKPLIDAITQICGKRGIAYVAAFDLGDDLYGTTVLLSEEHVPPTMLHKAIDEEVAYTLTAMTEAEL